MLLGTIKTKQMKIVQNLCGLFRIYELYHIWGCKWGHSILSLKNYIYEKCYCWYWVAFEIRSNSFPIFLSYWHRRHFWQFKSTLFPLSVCHLVQPIYSLILFRTNQLWLWNSHFQLESRPLPPKVFTGKFLSEALILGSTNPQYDKRLFIDLPVQYMKTTSSEHGENMLCA